ncbi:MAG: hypothetical protein CMO80_12750 [Verrucomicrobiales bacterium]|nr:hypothetical protein [Verrucomicrobiales bacterium]
MVGNEPRKCETTFVTGFGVVQHWLKMFPAPPDDTECAPGKGVPVSPGPGNDGSAMVKCRSRMGKLQLPGQIVSHHHERVGRPTARDEHTGVTMLLQGVASGVEQSHACIVGSL